MLLTENVIDFIEQTKSIRLFDYQKRFVDNLVHGKITRVPRACGTSMLIDGYASYLRTFYERRDFHFCDDCISGYEVMNSNLLSRSLISKTANSIDASEEERKKKFEMEYVVFYDDFV